MTSEKKMMKSYSLFHIEQKMEIKTLIASLSIF